MSEPMLNNQSLLITGGTGSFGMKCTEILLKEYSLRRLIIFSRDELKQYEMEQKFSVQKYPQLLFFSLMNPSLSFFLLFSKTSIDGASMEVPPQIGDLTGKTTGKTFVECQLL